VRRFFRRQLPPDAETLHLARGVRAHQRFVRLRVAAPLVLSGALIVIVPSVFALALSAERFSTVAAFMSLLITAPTALLCLLPYVLLIVFAYGARRAYKGTRHTLGRLHRAARRVNLTAQKLSKRAAEPVIALNARYAALERLISAPFRAIRISEPDETADHD
jgi:membrane protein implicated in regulation of membrane protease activity